MVLNLAAGLIGRGHRTDIVLFQTKIYHPIPEHARVFVAAAAAEDSPPEEVAAPVVQLRPRATLSDWARAASALRWDPRCLPSKRLVRQTRAVARYIEDEKPDCVVSSLARADTAALLASRFLGDGHPPVMSIVHNLIEYRGRRHRRRYRHLTGTAAHFAAVSQGIADSLPAAIGVPEESVTTIYNPVVTPDLRARMAEPPEHPWLLDGGSPVVLAAGRLAEQKDFPTLIKAFARLAARRPARLIIIGEGSMGPRLERLVQRLGVTDRISLPGWLSNPFAAMARASLFAMSSIHEGLPTVLVEALACGCPCVSTDCPTGPAEILQDGRLGPLVPVGDDEALAEAMARVLDQPPDRRRLQGRAADFSVERAAAAYEKLFRSVCPTTDP